jgi:hypothetical protein
MLIVGRIAMMHSPLKRRAIDIDERSEQTYPQVEIEIVVRSDIGIETAGFFEFFATKENLPHACYAVCIEESRERGWLRRIAFACVSKFRQLGIFDKTPSLQASLCLEYSRFRRQSAAFIDDFDSSMRCRRIRMKFEFAKQRRYGIWQEQIVVIEK